MCVCGSSVSSKLPEQVFPDATPRPAHKAIIDRCRRSILGRAIAPATAAFQNMHDTADDAAVVRPLDAPYIRRQMRFDPSPLLVAQPKQVPAHNPDPLPKTNQDRIVRAKKLMSSDPNQITTQWRKFHVLGRHGKPASYSRRIARVPARACMPEQQQQYRPTRCCNSWKSPKSSEQISTARAWRTRAFRTVNLIHRRSAPMTQKRRC